MKANLLNFCDLIFYNTVMKRANLIMVLLVVKALLKRCDKEGPLPNIHIPDNNFLNALIELGVDINEDGSISSEEAENNLA
jgi:hypothetical protein